MEAIPHVDSLVSEYLTFRGYTSTLRTFQAEQSTDQGCNFQAHRLADLILKELVVVDSGAALMRLLQLLADRCYSRLDSSWEPSIRQIEDSLLRLFLVKAVQAQRMDRVTAFFAAYGEPLARGPQASTWARWFTLPFIRHPERDPDLKVFFSLEWAALVDTSVRNFLQELMRSLPLPALLRFGAHQELQQSLSAEVAQLREENTRLQGQLSAAHGASPSLGLGHGTLAHEVDTGKPSSHGGALPTTARVPMRAHPVRGMALAELGQRLDDGWSGAAGEATGGASEGIPRSSGGGNSVRACSSEVEPAIEGAGEAPGRSAPEPQSAVEAAHKGECRVAERPGDQEPSGSDPASGGGTTRGLKSPSTESGGEYILLEGHEAPVTCCSFSSSGGNLATACEDGVLRICAPAALPQSEASRCASLQCGAPISALAFDRRADKLVLIGMRSGGVKAWHLDTRRMVATLQPEGGPAAVLALASSPTDSSFACSTVAAASGSDRGGRLALWNLRSFKRMHSISTPDCWPVTCLAFEPSGRWLASAASDGFVRLHGLGTPALHQSWQADSQRGSALCLALSTSGQHAATLGSERIVRLWDLRRTASAVTQLDVGSLFGRVSHAMHSLASSDVGSYRQRLALSSSGDQLALAAGLGGLAVLPLNLAEGLIGAPHLLPVPAVGSDEGFDAVEWHPKVDALAVGCSHGAVGISLPK